MSIYTYPSEAAVTPDNTYLVAVANATTGAVGKVTLSNLLAGAGGSADTTATQLTLTAASHAGRTVTQSGTPLAVTLPAATGTGNTYRLFRRIAATATSSSVKCVGTDAFSGVVHVSTTATTTNVAQIVASFKTTATDDTMLCNGTTTGGTVGDDWTFTDIATGVWYVHGRTTASGAYATPFSATV